MMNQRSNFAHHPAQRPFLAGYTLVEILVALTLTLILMSAVVKVFGDVGPSISNARKALEQFDRLRTAGQQLNDDLNHATARPDGRAARPEEAPGYLEAIEGSYLFQLNPGATPLYYAINATTGQPDYSVGERGDFVMLTVRNAAQPFVGRNGFDSNGNPLTVKSDVAEIAWFLRGNRLHRRVLLVVPGMPQNQTIANYDKKSFYKDYEISVHMANGKIVPNSLADLTKRENRFAHDARKFPFDARGWGTYGLPTLAECTSPTYMANWTTGSTPVPTPPPSASVTTKLDMWDNTPNGLLAKNLPDQALNANQDGLRISDDVVLTNVIGFDIKVWEPAANGGAGGYVDLGSNAVAAPGAPVHITPGKAPAFQPPLGPTYYRFNNGGIFESGLSGSGTFARVYDSGCFGYANELGNSQATNGFDDNIDGVVDDLAEYVVNSGMAPGVSPYPVPLRGIQIKIRCFEPDSKQIREITIEHDFLPK